MQKWAIRRIYGNERLANENSYLTNNVLQMRDPEKRDIENCAILYSNRMSDCVDCLLLNILDC